MRLLKVIYRHANLPASGKTIFRTAVRAIILQQGRLLMVFSPVNGDFKFPGGGVDPSEDHPDALRREVLEECGMRLSAIDQGFGKVIEYDLAEEPGFDLFQMTSYYYFCEVERGQISQRLDQYELELGFQSAWIEISAAIQANTAVLSSSGREIPYWTARETFVLQQIQEFLESQS